LEPMRDSRLAVRVFNLAGRAGDFSLAWHALGLVRAIGSMDRLREAALLSAVLAVESLVVNQGVKRLFRRARPTVSGDDRFAVRTPSTSSFPSGHASSAVFAAILLGSFTGAPLVCLWVGLAVLVAMSRVMVRIHHFTDIAAGAVTGALLGSVALAVSSAVLS
ncbi:MAG: phosphatase PAP2 family protein, partial [Actinomycetota bacterium]